VIHYFPTVRDERRREFRRSLDERAVLNIVNAKTSDFCVRVTDFSERGMTLRCLETIPLNTLVRIQMGAAIALGCIRHCTPSDEQGFNIGVEVEHFVSSSDTLSIDSTIARIESRPHH